MGTADSWSERRPSVLPQPLTASFWRGASGGVVLAGVIVSALAGAFFQSGLGIVADVVLGGLAGGVAVAVFAVGTLLVLRLAEALPTHYVAALGGAIGAVLVAYNVNFYVPEQLFYPSLFVFLWVEALLAGTLWIVVTGGLKTASTGANILILGLLVGALGVNVGGLWWLAKAGTVPDPVEAPLPPAESLPSLDAAHPAEKGDHGVQKLFYGSGTDLQRPAYGADVDVQTEPVDGSRILPEWEGFTADMREWYWGFGVERWPINGRVWMPDGEGPFPLVLVVHGNHSMGHYSDPGYAYLGELLASRGFITVSVDENFLNGSWSGDFGGDEIPARAWLLLKHLERWRAWNRTEGNPFYQRVDMDNIALVGHSRGGEAVPLAARFNTLPAFPDDTNEAFDFGFSIKSLVAFAPTDYRYERRPHLSDINYLSLQGSYDIDERSFFGIRQYQRVSFSEGYDGFKAGLYMHRGNHGQFNSEWGSTDFGPPTSWLLNTGPLIEGEDQRQVAKVYVSAFLEATLRDRDEYKPLFRNHHTADDWLPETTFLHRFKSPDFRPIATFEEDIDVTTATIAESRVEARRFTEWQERDLPFRGERTQQNNAVVLGWDPAEAKEERVPSDSAARYSIALPEEAPTGNGSEAATLVFSLARMEREKNTDADTEDTTDRVEGGLGIHIQLVDGEGRSVRVPLQQYGTIPPVLHTQYLKLRSLSKRYGDTWEPTLQTHEIPLSDLAAQNPAFNIDDLRSIALVPDRRQGGRMALDDVGLRVAQ